MELQRKIRRLSWFTLAELIVVITVLAILATVGFLALSGYTEDAKEASIKTNVRSVYSAIVSESAITGNSARYYVVHDTGAALSWAVIVVDGNPVNLTGWSWDAPNTNYSAGSPDYVKLKLNPSKFRVSWRWFSKWPWIEGASAADYREILTWAADVTGSAPGWKSRSAGFLQVAGISPVTKIASVAGNLPSDPLWNPMGLIKDPSSSATGVVVDGKAIGNVTVVSVTKSCQDIKSADAWSVDGIYEIDPDGNGGNGPIQAYCDMTTDGGGWTLTFYASSMPTNGSADLYNNQVVIKGKPLKTYTSNSATYPTLVNGTLNSYSELLFKWGNSTWAGQKGSWSRISMFPEWTTAMSVTFSWALNADGSTSLYHHSRGWTTGTIDPSNTVFWIWDDAWLSNICWWANTAWNKNCPYFQYYNYPYHYDTASERWLFVR